MLTAQENPEMFPDNKKVIFQTPVTFENMFPEQKAIHCTVIVLFAHDGLHAELRAGVEHVAAVECDEVRLAARDQLHALLRVETKTP